MKHIVIFKILNQILNDNRNEIQMNSKIMLLLQPESANNDDDFNFPVNNSGMACGLGAYSTRNGDIFWDQCRAL